jgi:hypothetical protein
VKLKVSDTAAQCDRLEVFYQMTRDEEKDEMADFIFAFMTALQDCKHDGHKFSEKQLCYRFYNALRLDPDQQLAVKSRFVFEGLKQDVDPLDEKFNELVTVVEDLLVPNALDKRAAPSEDKKAEETERQCDAQFSHDEGEAGKECEDEETPEAEVGNGEGGETYDDLEHRGDENEDVQLHEEQLGSYFEDQRTYVDRFGDRWEMAEKENVAGDEGGWHDRYEGSW